MVTPSEDWRSRGPFLGGPPSGGEVTVGFRVLSRDARDRISRATTRLRLDYPEAHVRLVPSSGSDESCGLANSSVDLAFVHLPLILDVGFLELDHHPVVVVMSWNDPLANHSEVSIDQLSGRRFVVRRTTDPRWEALIDSVLANVPSLSRLDDDDLHQLVAIRNSLALGLTVWPTSDPHPVPSLVVVPLAGVPPVPYGIAWRPDHLKPAAAVFLDGALSPPAK